MLLTNKLCHCDCREWKLTTVDPQERSTSRSGVRSAMCTAIQLPGRGSTDMDDAPAKVLQNALIFGLLLSGRLRQVLLCS